MRREYFEWLVGLFVLLGCVCFLFLAFKVSSPDFLHTIKQTYLLHANFDNIGGLKTKAKVTIAGVVIGRVTHIELDPNTYQARVDLNINQSFQKIPKDSSIVILTSGLLGDNFLGISPGSQDEELRDGDFFSETHAALSLEKLVSRFVTSSASSAP